MSTDDILSSGYIAHISKDGEIQTMHDHLCNVASMASNFSVVELRLVQALNGKIHDVGKYQMSFQERIRGRSIQVEHSICGAIEIPKYCNDQVLALLLQLCIAGHHSGIPDCGTIADPPDLPTLFGRLKRKSEDYCAYIGDITIEHISGNNFQKYLCEACKTKEDIVEKFAFLVRYSFSCLTDADSIDTRQAYGISEPQPLRFNYKSCLHDIDKKLSGFVAETELQKARQRLQQQVFSKTDADGEVFLMNMPTGSGKTLASMRYALKRIEHSNGKLKRIIYVIPYNSIIDQTVEIFEGLFSGHSDVLRHQSSFIYEEQENLSEDFILSAKYACENWDAGIIVTTAVQFFESLYGNRRNKLRKVHNLAESVIVFDEAHLMPREYLEPCLRGVSYIARYLHSEALLLTATMPDFRMLLSRYAIPDLQITDLVTDTSDFKYFRKCKYELVPTISDNSLVSKATSFASSLIVMNSRKGASEIFQLCSGEKYHLSTYMTAFDRANTIAKIKCALDALYMEFPDLSLVPPERKITVVSTSLIEAGVNLDFVAGFRELTGLDSILQTGGRVDRDGLRNYGYVFAFEREGTAKTRPEQELTKGIFAEFSDVSDPAAIRAYFDRLLNMEKEKFKMKSISNDCKRINLIPFRTYSESFHLIDGTKTVSIAICRDDYSRSLFEQLKVTGFINFRKIRKYCCTVRMNEFECLLQQRVLEDYGSGIYFLIDPSYYDEETGIQLEGKDYII